ncbi:MAG: tRNA-dihydrouridine synthase [Planctomycetota bacterium]|nr:tRNA-dihydrouridine synthase [Planctomycetota bacterium]
MATPPNLIRPVRIGAVSIERNLALAPMHEHTHLALRLLCRRQGAALAMTEMVTPEDLLAPPSAEELRLHLEAARPGARCRKAENVLRTTPEDRPLGVQLLPLEPGPAAEVVTMLAARGTADLVDLNFACPSERVVSSGRGGGMLLNPKTALRIVAAAVEASTTTQLKPSRGGSPYPPREEHGYGPYNGARAAGTETRRAELRCSIGRMPVTLKIRLGFSQTAASREQALGLAREAAAIGIAGLTLHARAVDQGYGGRADWGTIAEWTEALAPLPVFGSGDLRSPEAVLAMLRETGCAGASIARGALGAPWIFRQTIDLAARGSYEPATLQERRETLLAHFAGLTEQYGEGAAVKFMRRFATYYAKGFAGAAAARAAFQSVRTAEAFREMVEKWFAGE